MLSSFNLLVAAAAVVVAHGDHDQTPIEGPHKQLWYNTLPGDGGTQVCAKHHDMAY
jgi:agmatinase